MARKQSPTEPSVPDAHLLQHGDEFLNAVKAAAVLDRSPKTLEYWRTIGAGPRDYYQGAASDTCAPISCDGPRDVR